MEAQNTPKNEPYLCNKCQRRGTFADCHNDCERYYIDNILSKGFTRTELDCQCENIGHGWNVTTTMETNDDDPNWLRQHINTSGNSKTFKNNQWCDVAEVIQNNYVFLTLRDTKEKQIWYYS
jgi:hypothetical protein